MAKTQAPSKIKAGGEEFITDAVPDPFDERDLEYRARLQPLPAWLDCRPSNRRVMKQTGNSCTGHALAAVINAIYSAYPIRPGEAVPEKPPRVSPYMLYHLARRYDEYDGEDDAGSSIRGALKGWFYHGVVLESKWRVMESENRLKLDDEDFKRLAGEHPLGAFYRVNAFRLDDMQSAINELNGICCSAAVHSGWMEPQRMRLGNREMSVILRPGRLDNQGGHAFAIVGYNEIGFLVQNSWGDAWGAYGYATLPYDDWLDSAYDAWVARPGVPKTPSYRGRTNAVTTSGEVGTAPGPDLVRLQNHVVNIGNNGRLSDRGKFASSPEQIDKIFNHMEERHDQWHSADGDEPRRIVLYAHGGLHSESTGLKIASRHRGWWLNNHVYPVYFDWQSGAVETLVNDLTDLGDTWLPSGIRGFDALEAFDGLIEKGCRRTFRRTWAEMKENATRASDDDENSRDYRWPPPAGSGSMLRAPAGTLTVQRLAKYLKEHPEAEVHVVGHSAGSIFLAELFRQLLEARIEVTSMHFLAPALRVDRFRQKLLPHLGKSIKRFTVIGLSKEAELDDVCGTQNVDIYHKSLLYLVSRAFEEGAAEVPLLGMEKFMEERSEEDQPKLIELIRAGGGNCFFAPSNVKDAEDSRSNATSHAGLDDDSPTMTSVMLRVINKTSATEEMKYQTSTPEKVPVRSAGSASIPAKPRVSKADAGEEQPAPGMVESEGTEHDVTVAPSGEKVTPSPVELMLANRGWRRASRPAYQPESRRNSDS